MGKKKAGLFTKIYGGKKGQAPSTQDTQRHFGRGPVPKHRDIRPFGKGV